MILNYRLVGFVLGLLLLFNGLFMLLCIPASLIFGEESWKALGLAGAITTFTGGLMSSIFLRADRSVKKREGYAIVSLSWVLMAIFGSLPYLISGTIPNISHALFETMSGFTTTGATILDDIESLPKGILLWRSVTHWIGGMGIIVLAVAILPFLGIGGMQLFSAESPGPSTDKLHPRITETAKRLWFIYVAFTVIEMFLLKLAGMTWYDAINHAMSTMSTGGFSTKNASVAHYDSALIQYIIILFMILAGMNFSMTYFALKGKLRKVWYNDEWRMYMSAIAIVVTVSTLIVFFQTPQDNIELAFRESLFQVVAVITTTGFVTADFTAWTPFLTLIFFALMFVGGSAGSTSGGVKIIRHIIIHRNSVNELKRLIHPSAVLPVKFNRTMVNQKTTYNVLAFFLIYLLVFLISSASLAAMGLDFDTALGAGASCLGNVGPGLAGVGPVENYTIIPDAGKVLLLFTMLLGRLEIFTVVVLLSPSFWKKT
jgi:trk system potassium uptake protein TrkH